MTTASAKPRYSKKAPSRGGYRPGGGRPKGATTKITITDLMSNIELQAGESYASRLAKNYVTAIYREDWSGVRDYDKAFMNKLVADLVDVEVSESEDAMELKRAAFAEAIAQIQQKSTKD